MAGSAPARRPPGSRRGPYAKSGETRERILAAALEVAGEVGIHRSSVARIAERAGVAVGNVHYHFGSREELLREAQQWVLDELLRQVDEATRGAGGFFATHEASLRAYLAFVRANPAWVRLSEETRHHHPEIYREGLATLFALMRETLEQGIAAGELRPMTPDEIALQAQFLLGGRYFLDQALHAGVDGRPYPGDDAVVAAYLELVRSGLSKEAS